MLNAAKMPEGSEKEPKAHRQGAQGAKRMPHRSQRGDKWNKRRPNEAQREPKGRQREPKRGQESQKGPGGARGSTILAPKKGQFGAQNGSPNPYKIGKRRKKGMPQITLKFEAGKMDQNVKKNGKTVFFAFSSGPYFLGFSETVFYHFFSYYLLFHHHHFQLA